MVTRWKVVNINLLSKAIKTFTTKTETLHAIKHRMVLVLMSFISKICSNIEWPVSLNNVGSKNNKTPNKRIKSWRLWLAATQLIDLV